ncbi:HTH lysR-type domain-containing protein, partial [Dysosmobacter welbionis]
CAGEHGQVHTEPVGIAARQGCLTFLFRVMPAILLV